MKVHLITYTPDPDKVVASAARLCYSDKKIEDLLEGMTKEKADSLVSMLADMGHESPFEHVSFTFGIEEISRVLSHQLVRHRLSSYSQRSQRYVNDSNNGYFTPKAIKRDLLAKEQYDDFIKQAFENYDSVTKSLMEDLLEDLAKDKYPEFFKEHEKRSKSSNYAYSEFLDEFKENFPKDYNRLLKIAQEDARYVLPNACHTSMIVTMNARTLLNFFSLRCCRRAQDEINELAWEMLKKVKEVAPRIFSIAGPGCVTSKCPEGNMTCGNPY